MTDVAIEHDVMLWMEEDVPVRMFYGGRRWRVSDTPTRLRESIWSISVHSPRGLYGWRFQGTDQAGESLVFDVFRAEGGWHVHHAYRCRCPTGMSQGPGGGVPIILPSHHPPPHQ